MLKRTLLSTKPKPMFNALRKTVLAAIISIAGFNAMAQSIVDVTTAITSNTTWTKNNIYVLKGMIAVKNGATLTIQPGTEIRGDKTIKGGLLITRDGMINANGTACEPIVFTSNQPVGQRNYGDWFGVIILGDAPINQTSVGNPGTALIEGGNFGEDGRFGGTNPNDNSGIFRYVRIEYPGIAFTTNNETNGLTMGGVGNGTQIDHIQVSFSGDDGFEWFGGTVNCSHLISYQTWDDDLDTDWGYTGKVQFVYVIRNIAIADVSQSNGFEADNDGTGTAATPVSEPYFSNVTIIGPREFTGTPNTLYRRAMHLRRNTRNSIYNSVFVGYPTGLFVDGTAANNNYAGGLLQLANNVMANMGSDFDASMSAAAIARYDSINARFASTSSLGFATGYNNLNTPSLLPTAGSILQSGADFSNTRLQDPFFTAVTFRGAFGTQDWTLGWAKWDLNNTSFHNLRPSNLVTSVGSTGTIMNVGFRAGTGTNLTYFIQYKLATATTWTTSNLYNGITVTSGTTVINRQLSLPAGNYQVRVGVRSGAGAINWGCVANVALVCNRDINLFPTNIFCARGNDGRITSSYVNYRAPYTVSWRNANNVQIGTGSAVGSLTAGTYSLTVTDNMGCSTTKSVTLTQPDTTDVPMSPVVSGSNLSRRVTFRSVPGALRYQYIGRRADGVVLSARTVGAGTANDTVLQLASNPIYTAGGAGTVTARIRAVMPTRNSSYTCEVFGIIALPARIDGGSNEPSEVVSEKGFSVFPNPAVDVLNLNYEFSSENSAVVNIYSVTGALVSSRIIKASNGFANETIDVKDLNRGLYLVQVVEGAQAKTLRVVVSK